MLIFECDRKIVSFFLEVSVQGLFLLKVAIKVSFLNKPQNLPFSRLKLFYWRNAIKKIKFL